MEWDDAALSNDRATAWIDAALASDHDELGEPRDITVPVRYGGLDTDDVTEATGLSEAEIASVHEAGEYRVCARATVGQPMLAGTDERLRVPRRPVPRTDVPALAVAVANEQATIYPVLMPGGWNVIGTALENVYDPHRDDPFFFGLGDRVRFRAAKGDPPPSPKVRELLPPEPRRPALRVEAHGALDLVLDAGRLNQAHHGMAQSGPLDAAAARLANALCDNPAGTTLIESTMKGPTLVALCTVIVGAAGRGMRLEVDGEPVGQITTVVQKGQRLELVPTGEGMRGYLAVAGGIEAESFLGSARRRSLRPRRPAAARRATFSDWRVSLRRRRARCRRERPRSRRTSSSDCAAVPNGRRRPKRALRGALHGQYGRPDGRAAGRPGRARRRAALGVPAARRRAGARRRRADPAARRPPAQRRLRQAGRHPSRRPPARGAAARGRAIRFVVVGDHPVPWFRDLN